MEKNVLALTTEKTILFAPGGEPESTYVIEIISPSEDDLGRPMKKPHHFAVTQALVRDLRNGLTEIERANPTLTPRDGLVQIRYEGDSGFVIIFEVPPYDDVQTIKTRWVIGDGAQARFIFEKLPDVQDFCRGLESAFGLRWPN